MPNLLVDEEISFDTALQDVKSKHASCCPGSKVSHDDHHWGLPGPHYQGSSEDSFQLLSSHMRDISSLGDKSQLPEVKATSKPVVALNRKVFFVHLDALALEEQEFAELEELHVIKKEAALAGKRQLLSTGAVAMVTALGPQQQQWQCALEGLFTLRDLCKQQHLGMSFLLPLDALLNHLLGLPPTFEGHPSGFTW